MPLKTCPTSEDIAAMIASVDNLRDQAILSFYADTGARVSELLSIEVDNVDLENRTIMIRHLKRGIKKKCSCGRSAGRNTKFCSKCGADLGKVIAEGISERQRLISVSEETAQLFKEYITATKPEGKLFNLSRQSIYEMVRRAAAAVGLDGKCIINPVSGKKHFVHPHNFRDSLAVSWLAVAGDNANKQKALQEQFGHASYDTTMRYNKLSPAKVKSVSDEVREARFGNKEEKD
jgi:integrase/recombinase XerD